MRVILLAAGEGSRLRPYTLDRPKCLVELGGNSLLGHQLAALQQLGLRDIHICTGYRREQLEAFGYPTHHNPDYASTNMVTSLMCAADLFDGNDDVLIAYADLVYEARVLEALCECPAPLSTTVDLLWRQLWSLRNEDPLNDAETLKLSPSGDVAELGKRPASLDEIEGQYMGLIKVRASHALDFVKTYRALSPDVLYDGKPLSEMCMTSFLQHIIDSGQPIRAVLVEGGWLEVDTAGDLEIYGALLREGRLSETCLLPSEARR